MPLYVYECKSGHQVEIMRPVKDHALPVECDTCRGVAALVIVGSHPDRFPTGLWDDIDTKPVEIRSRKHLEEVCRSRGVYARNYMENYSPRERAIRSGF